MITMGKIYGDGDGHVTLLGAKFVLKLRAKKSL